MATPSCTPNHGGGEDGGSQRMFVVKGHWKPSEDTKLRDLVAVHGPRNWNIISEQFPGRSGKSCRLRWVNQLDPRIKKTVFSREEDRILIAAHIVFGNQWSQIAKFIPGRTDNAIKNHWHVLNSRRHKNAVVVSSSCYLHVPVSGDSNVGMSESGAFMSSPSRLTRINPSEYLKLPMPFIDFLGVGD